jgi:hypothetical protein
MAADLKSLQDALSSLTAFIAPLEAHRKYVEQCGATMKAYEKVSEALEKQLGDLINELKKTKNNTLSEADEKELNAAIQKWYRSQLSAELRNVSGYCSTQLKYLLDAQKDVLAVTK